MNAVRLLPSEQRLVNALTARGLTLTHEINRTTLALLAEDLGYAPATVRSSLSHIRRHLREVGALPEKGRGSVTSPEREGCDAGNRNTTPAEAAERLERRPVTRAMLAEAALDFARAAAGGRSAAELREQWATVGAWLGTL